MGLMWSIEQKGQEWKTVSHTAETRGWINVKKKPMEKNPKWKKHPKLVWIAW